MSLTVLVIQADVQLLIFTAAESESKFREFASAVRVELVVAHENFRIGGALRFSSLNLFLVHGRCLSRKGLLDFFGRLYLGGLRGLHLACCHCLSHCLIHDRRIPVYCAIRHFAFLTFLGDLTLVTGMTTST